MTAFLGIRRNLLLALDFRGLPGGAIRGHSWGVPEIPETKVGKGEG